MERTETPAQRIKRAMKMRGMKGVELSKATGISRPALSYYINGKRQLNDAAIYKIAHALMVDEVWLLGYGDESESSATKSMLIRIIQGMTDEQIEKTIKFIEEYIL